jgi:hypothetical protein
VEKGRYLPWSKEEEGAYIFWMKQVPVTNSYQNFKGLLYIWEEMIMMALLHMAGLENSECIWKIQRKPEVAVSV